MAVFVGYALGNAAIGQVAAWLIPEYGWSIVFLVAGSAGLLLSVFLAVMLPESIPFLAATRPGSPHLRRLVARAAPELEIPPDAKFVYRRPVNETQFSLKLLFNGYRRTATPIIWLAFFAESMTYLTLTAWLVVVLEQAGVAPIQAALAYSYAQLGAMVLGSPPADPAPVWAHARGWAIKAFFLPLMFVFVSGDLSALWSSPLLS